MALLLPLRGLLQNPATEREKTYSKTSTRDRERGGIQKPAREREEEVFKNQQERKRGRRGEILSKEKGEGDGGRRKRNARRRSEERSEEGDEGRSEGSCAAAEEASWSANAESGNGGLYAAATEAASGGEYRGG